MARRRVPFRIGPPPEPPQKPKPFTALAKPRYLPLGLPSDLMTWYVRHEGVGRQVSQETHPVRLHKHAEITPITGPELWIDGGGDEYPGWEKFRGLRVGIGQFFEDFIYVTNGPDFRFGSILAVGADVPEDGVLVLAVNWNDWLNRLARDEWVEHALTPGAFKDLPLGKVGALRRHLKRLNPKMTCFDAPRKDTTPPGGTDGG